jgi:hypothetical protein
MRGVVRPTGYARGLVSLDRIYEYQAASVCAEGENEYQVLAELLAKIAEANVAQAKPQAPRIPTMPEVVDYASMTPGAAPVQVPIGISEGSLQTVYLDYGEGAFKRCLFNKPREGATFINAVCTMLATKQNHYTPVVIDLAGILTPAEDAPYEVITGDEQAREVFTGVLQEADEAIQGKPGTDAQGQRFIIMSGMAGFINRLDSISAQKLRAYLKGLRAGGDTAFLLFDTAADTVGQSEEWFKVQISNRNALWLGGGLANQGVVTTNYVSGKSIDQALVWPRGYYVTDGLYEAIKCMSKC